MIGMAVSIRVSVRVRHSIGIQLVVIGGGQLRNSVCHSLVLKIKLSLFLNLANLLELLQSLKVAILRIENALVLAFMLQVLVLASAIILFTGCFGGFGIQVLGVVLLAFHPSLYIDSS